MKEYYEKIYESKIDVNRLKKIKSIAPFKKVKKDFVKGFVKNKKGNIIELGCGLGEYLSLFKGRLFGTDISLNALKKAKIFFNEADYFQADCTKLPLKDQSVDVVLLPDVIEHIEDDELLLNEISRVCKKDSLFVIITHFSGGYKTKPCCEPNMWTNVLGEGGDLRVYGFDLLDRLRKKGFGKFKVRLLFGPLTSFVYLIKNNILNKSKIKREDILSGKIVERKSGLFLRLSSFVLYLLYKLDYLLFSRIKGKIILIGCKKVRDNPICIYH